MKRIVGFALFWIAAGMLLALVIPGLFCQILCMILCVAVGYCLVFVAENQKVNKKISNNSCNSCNSLLE